MGQSKIFNLTWLKTSLSRSSRPSRAGKVHVCCRELESQRADASVKCRTEETKGTIFFLLSEPTIKYQFKKGESPY